MADAFATDLPVLGPDEGLRQARRDDGLDAIFVTRDGVRATAPLDLGER